jgi:hypothetical protein
LTIRKKLAGRTRNYLISLELLNATYQTAKAAKKTAGIQDAAGPDCKSIQVRKYS